MTPVLKKLIDDRWSAYRSRNWPLYNHLKEKVKGEVFKAKKSWCDRVMQWDKNVWKMVKELKGKRDNCSFPNKEPELSLFLSKLSDVFKSYFNSKDDASLNVLSDEVWNVKIDSFDVYHLLKNLKFKQSSGYDEVSARLLWESADIVCDPLAEIFRSSVRSRTFPSFWKNALVRPIPKKNQASVYDFRPISLLPIVAKIFERLILYSMKEHFLRLFDNSQHAFRPGGSTTSALVAIHDTVTSYLENPDSIGVKITCLDFSKAFDKLQHNMIVNSLIDRGMNNGFLTWLHSFLINPWQRICVNGNVGLPFLAKSSVPQGSVIGPYLFGVFIALLEADSQSARLVKYADDITLIELFTKDCPNLSHLAAIQDWILKHDMVLNRSKCCQMIIHRVKDRCILPYDDIQVVKSVNILGVTLSDDLRWDAHFDNVLLNASRRLHVLRCLKPFVSKEKLCIVFNGLILSIIMYASPLFCKVSTSVVLRLERVRRRAHRIICGDNMCECNLIPEFSSHRKKLALKFLKSCCAATHPLHERVPRIMPRSRKYFLLYCSTYRRLNSFFQYACLIYNDQLLRSFLFPFGLSLLLTMSMSDSYGLS